MSERKPYLELSDKQKTRRLDKVFENSINELLYANKNRLKSNTVLESVASNSNPQADLSRVFRFDNLQSSSYCSNLVSENESNCANNVQIPEGSEDLDNYSLNSDDFSLGNNNVGPDFRADNVDKESDLRYFLYHWAITYQIRQNALTNLLHGLKKYGHDDLPSDARTLLHTPKKTTVSFVGSGLYSHYGLKKGLIVQLKCFEQNKIPNDIALHLNIDGLPLSKSSPSQVWPILVKIVNYPYAACDPFAVGIFHGNRKPEDVNLFLQPTIIEYLELSNTGFIFNNQRYRVFIKLFAADTVARNQMLCFPPHNI
ncbi:uncharacterized protein LOC143896004 [Temnothorax americanus]|uniref:uncharacterized protein LOC143896004 n=1 Tax=Temnothorax americanus TaxID=1964332 RepID=UPI00406832DB